MSTDTLARQLAAEAIEQATDFGTRHWLRAPRVDDNDFGGVDIATTTRVYRLAQDDTTVRLFVFTAGSMVVEESAEFTPGLAHMAAAYIAEALR